MRIVTLAAAALLAAPALSQDWNNSAVISNCEFQNASAGAQLVECDVTNTTETAIAKVAYAFRVAEKDRTVPWLEEGFEKTPPRRTDIPGGIEPGETVRLLIGRFYAQGRMDLSRVYVEAFILSAYDIAGDEISPPY